MQLINKEILDEHPIFDENKDEKKLFEAIQKNKLVIFYGAGVSMLAGCSGWEDLAKEIILKMPDERCSKLDKTILLEMTSVEPKKSISICHALVKDNKKLLNKNYFCAIIDAVKPTNIDAFINVHDLLYQLKARCYITTNIDKGIELISDKIGLDKKEKIDLTDPKLRTNENLSKKIRDGNFFYLHGTIDNIHHSIFTTDSYFRFYKKPQVNKFLKEIFRGDFTVLFIGYSLNDYEILQNIFLALDKENVNIYNHYLLSPIYSRDFAKFSLEKEYFRTFSIKAIPYFIDFEGYEKLYSVLNKIIKIVDDLGISMKAFVNKVDKVLQ